MRKLDLQESSFLLRCPEKGSECHTGRSDLVLSLVSAPEGGWPPGIGSGRVSRREAGQVCLFGGQ